ncbi:MAG: radical SAM protein [Planctomycetota bacterium]
MAALILKATERCNSNCYYCDVVRKEGSGKSMPLEVLEAVFERIGEYLRAQPYDDVELLWHGGEPLLLGADYFRSALELQNEHCGGASHRIQHSIQTNLTLFSEDFVGVFEELGIGAVGTSFDPEPHVRGFGTSIDSAEYQRRFFRALRLLERHRIGWGMIYVVTRKSLARPLEVFTFLTNMNLTGGINFNPVLIYDEERQDIAVSPTEYVEFLGAIFGYWWKHRSRFPDIQPFRSLVETVIDGRVSLGCVDSGDCSYHHLNIAPDGETSQCGRSADWALLPYGNIKERPIAELLFDEQRDEFVRRQRLLLEGECRGCRFWGLCHGGCPLDAWSRHRSFLHKSEWCEAKRGFLRRYFEPVTGVRYEPEPAGGSSA